MMYAQSRGTYYIQLEDDILTKPNFVAIMRDFALEKSAAHESWFVIDFCQLGFIGKMFSSTSLPILIQFFLSFYNDKPGDWLLDNVIQAEQIGFVDFYRLVFVWKTVKNHLNFNFFSWL